MSSKLYPIFLIVFSVAILFVGCGDSENFVFTPNQANANSTGTNPNPNPNPNPQPQTGNLAVQLQLLNARAVKSDVRTFRVQLSQGGLLVRSEDFTRVDVGADQTLTVEGIEPVNGDAFLDLVSANSNSYNVSGLLGNGDGTFQSAVNFGTGQTQPPW